ncbi:MAG: hydroxymethylbilane synthase [Geminicoccaceae bacterium]
MATAPKLRIGTRGSPLALAQTHMVRDLLAKAHDDLAEPGAIDVVVISTKGDRILDRALAEIGGKGLFTEEIEDGLRDGTLDLAVHSMKDMPTELPDGLIIDAMLPREDVRDAFICQRAGSLDDLPHGAVIGSASLRRKAQLLAMRPDLQIITFRGNVQTRLRKLAAGEVDATLLALAGLRRLNMADVATAIFDEQSLLPAVAQGAIGIECRADATRTRGWLATIDDKPTRTCVDMERAMLAALDGSCRTPIAGLARLSGDTIHLDGLVARTDGSEVLRTARDGASVDAVRLGRDAGEELKRRAGPGFFT